MAVLVAKGVAPALHVYAVPLLAVKVAVCPAQIVGEFTVIAGGVVTVTVAMPVPEQEPVVPVTVYVVVLAGETSTVFGPAGVVPALHVYVVAPVAVNEAV